MRAQPRGDTQRGAPFSQLGRSFRLNPTQAAQVAVEKAPTLTSPLSPGARRRSVEEASARAAIGLRLRLPPEDVDDAELTPSRSASEIPVAMPSSPLTISRFHSDVATSPRGVGGGGTSPMPSPLISGVMRGISFVSRDKGARSRDAAAGAPGAPRLCSPTPRATLPPFPSPLALFTAGRTPEHILSRASAGFFSPRPPPVGARKEAGAEAGQWELLWAQDVMYDKWREEEPQTVQALEKLTAAVVRDAKTKVHPDFVRLSLQVAGSSPPLALPGG